MYFIPIFSVKYDIMPKSIRKTINIQYVSIANKCVDKRKYVFYLFNIAMCHAAALKGKVSYMKKHGFSSKRHRRIFCLVLSLLICLSATACGKNPPVESDNPDSDAPLVTSPPAETTSSPSEPVSSTVQMKNFEILSPLTDSYEYDFSEFSLGSKKYTTAGGHEMPYDMRGIVAVPKGDGPFPLVLIAHGAHEEEDESKRFDTGFEYLVKALAQNGYAAVSMDMLKPYIQRYGGNDDYIQKFVTIANDHVEGLLAACEGENLFPLDLQGKIDFNKVTLLGHSRSGSAVFQLAKAQLDKGLGIKAILSLAPSADFYVDFVDMPIAFLVPQYDGDVIQLDGIFMYDFLDGRIFGDHSVTTLMGANHNFFSSSLDRDDTIADEIENAYPRLSPEQQQEFLINFAVDFFNASLDSDDNFYRISHPQPNKMYGQDINRQLRMDAPINLIDPGTADNFTGSNANISHVKDSVFYTEDEILINTVTTSVLKSVLDDEAEIADTELEYIPLNRNLISVEWTQKDSSLSVMPLVRDFSGKKAMSIHLIPDSASNLNSLGNALTFTIVLTDVDGNTAEVITAANQNSLSTYPGELRKTVLTEDFSIEFFEPTTPLGMLNIPLSYFEAVNLNSIESMEIIFSGNESGAIFISAWQIQ